MNSSFGKYFLFGFSIFLFISGILYLIPSFELKLFNNWFVYKSIPSVFGTSENLNFRHITVTPTYEYVITANSSPSDFKEKFYFGIHDAEVIRQRIKTFVGDNFEVKTNFTDEKIEHVVYLNFSIDEYINLITSTNSEFKIFEKKNSPAINADITENNEVIDNTTDITEIELDIKRSDFGTADIKEIKTNDNRLVYQVRLPLSIFLSYERLKYITSQIGKNLNTRVGGMEFQVFIDYNENYTPTGLVVFGITDRKQALMIKSFLNSSPTKLKYDLSTVTFRDKGLSLFYFSYLLSFFILLIISLVMIKVKEMSYKTFFKLVLNLTLFLSVLKLFDFNVSLHVVFLCVVGLILSLQIKYFNFLILLFGCLIILKLMTVLRGIDIGLFSMLIILFFVFSFKLQNTFHNNRLEAKI